MTAMTCPYCGSDNVESALVCAACARDIAVPASLIAERDELLRKRDRLRSELREARNEIEAIKTGRKRR
jgi:hypothetical protein